MSSGPQDPDITKRVIQGSDTRKASELLPLVYDELRRAAQAQIARRGAGQTLQATGLVHEAWMRVVGDEDPGWEGRAHFFGAAAKAMRNILVEQHRRKLAVKRDGKQVDVEAADDYEIETDARIDDILSLDEALTALERKDETKARIVMLRFFTGLSMPAVAEVLGLPLTRVEREWRYTRAWLSREVEGEQ